MDGLWGGSAKLAEPIGLGKNGKFELELEPIQAIEHVHGVKTSGFPHGEGGLS